MRLLINAANLRVGGGVAVAASFLADLANRPHEASLSTVVASSFVDRNLKSLSVNTNAFHQYQVFDQYGIKALWKKLPVSLKEFDTVFTVFGPRYSFQKHKRAVTGFAQPWIIYPDNDLIKRMPRLERILIRFKYRIQASFFCRDSLIIVEHEAVKNMLEKMKPFKKVPIEVVESEVGSIFFDPSKWIEVAIDLGENQSRIGVVSRNYPHKNLAILPEIKRILESEFDMRVTILVTLSSDEWDGESDEFKNAVRNVGTLTIAEVPSFMSQMDVLVLPTLLECYSSGPNEARVLKIPIVASDRDFIRNTAGNYPKYVNPTDARNIAEGIREVLSLGAQRTSAGTNEHDIKPRDRTRSDDYLEILMRQD